MGSQSDTKLILFFLFLDSASIQTSSVHNTPNHVNFRSNHHTQYIEQAEIQKRSLLATVRASHTRGRCRQGQVRQTLAETPIPVCPTHSHHAVPLRNMNSSIIGIAVTSDLEEAEDPDDSDQIMYKNLLAYFIHLAI